MVQVLDEVRGLERFVRRRAHRSFDAVNHLAAETQRVILERLG